MKKLILHCEPYKATPLESKNTNMLLKVRLYSTELLLKEIL